MNRKERFNQAYNYAYDKGLIHSQKDLSEKMQTTESNKARTSQPALSAKVKYEKLIPDSFH